MSISLPKLELPQISIKASVKQKKPFTLQLPVIKFNAHAATEEDDSGYPTGGEGYASGGPDTSGYAGVQSGGYVGPAANMGYERPSAGQYGTPEPDSGYASSSSQQAPAAAAPVYQEQPNQYQSQPNQYQSQPQSYGPSAQQQNQQQYQQQPPQPEQQYQQPQPAYVQSVPSNHQEPQRHPHYGFQGRSVADYRASTSSNGYYVPRPTSQNRVQTHKQPVIQYQNSQFQQQVPQQQIQSIRQPVDGNVKYYEAAQLYQQPQIQMNQAAGPAGNYEIITAPEFAKLYGSRLHSNFARRTTIRAPQTDYETLWYAASNDQKPSVIPAPPSMTGWTPIVL